MSSRKEKKESVTLQAPDFLYGQGERSASLGEIWKMVVALGDLKPPSSPRPIVGPVLTWIRQGLWRLIGFEPAQRQLAALVCKIFQQFRNPAPDILRFLEGCAMPVRPKEKK